MGSSAKLLREILHFQKKISCTLFLHLNIVPRALFYICYCIHVQITSINLCQWNCGCHCHFFLSFLLVLTRYTSESSSVMIQLEGSGNWPLDIEAIEKTKSAFLLKIGER